MAIFVGFSTQHVNMPRTIVNQGVDGGGSVITNNVKYGRKYKITDSDLVIQDFINALNIPQGQKPGKPSYGTTLWGFIFEPNTVDTQLQLENEIRRVASLDPRINLNTLTAYPSDSGILIEVELAITPFNNAQTLSIMFDQASSSAFGL
jgi:phage baseplate assembly protein W